MDTRTKIVAPEAAVALARRIRAEGRRLAVVTGHFDVLLADHLRSLPEAAKNTGPAALMIVLSPPAQPVLAARPRAEMVAGLAMVDYVVIGEGGHKLEELLDALAPDRVLRLEALHEQRARQLIEHVHRRQTA